MIAFPLLHSGMKIAVEMCFTNSVLLEERREAGRGQKNELQLLIVVMSNCNMLGKVQALS